MDINVALENTLLNERMRTSELLSNMEGVLFLIKQCKSSPELDILRLTPIIEYLYSDYFYSNLSYAKDEEDFFNKYNYIKKEYQDFFGRKIEEQPFYNTCISNLCSRVTAIDKVYVQKFMSENVNFNNIEDMTKHHIAVGLLKGKAHHALDILLKNKIINTDFINKDYDGNLIQQNTRNSFYPYMVDSEILKVFIKNGLDLNGKKRLCYTIGINMHRDPAIKNILKKHLTTENSNTLNEQVYNYQNGKFIADFRKFFITQADPFKSSTKEQYQIKTGFRDFWTLKYNDENIFYNLVRKSEIDNLDKDTVRRIIERIMDDKDNVKKYQRMYIEKNKDGLNALEFFINECSVKKGFSAYNVNEDWLNSLTTICKIDPANDISVALRNSNFSDDAQENIFKSIKKEHSPENVSKIFIGENSLLLEDEIKTVIKNILGKNSRTYSDKKLLDQMEMLGIVDSTLYIDKYIAGSLYLYMSCLKETGFSLSKKQLDFTEELRNKKPLLHNYEHEYEILKIYVSELEKNHLLNAATQSNDVSVKSIRRL